jgi:VanZ family protein
MFKVRCSRFARCRNIEHRTSNIEHPTLKPPRTVAWIAVALWAAVIFYLSSLTGKDIARLSPFDFWDKAAHFTAYAAGGVVLAAALRWSFAWSWKKLIFVGVLALSLYGVTDEIHQLSTPFRSGGDLGDWIADTLGAIAGVKLFQFCHARFQPARRAASPGA